MKQTNNDPGGSRWLVGDFPNLTACPLPLTMFVVVRRPDDILGEDLPSISMQLAPDFKFHRVGGRDQDNKNRPIMQYRFVP